MSDVAGVEHVEVTSVAVPPVANGGLLVRNRLATWLAGVLAMIVGGLLFLGYTAMQTDKALENWKLVEPLIGFLDKLALAIVSGLLGYLSRGSS